MDFPYYLDKFELAANKIDKKELKEKKLEYNLSITLNSVVLKLYKPEWSNDRKNPVHAKSRVFFSIWVNEKTLKEKKLFYTIHAFKLRHLPSFAIASRDFAKKFRHGFKKYQNEWENVSVNFGPLTLMEGWDYFENESLENKIVLLCNKFINVAFLIDTTLKQFKK